MTLPRTLSLAMIDGVRVTVPDSLEQITPYVLREQHDWFEDEIGFVRRLLLPGEKAIDVGANFGVYALAMARLVGPAGHVWAYEPSSETAAFLAASVRENGFSQLTLEQIALSAKTGMATLALNADSELNALVETSADAFAPAAVEHVRVTTLDERLVAHEWRAIAFIKLDAEGEEMNILHGGRQFFAGQSPLVQYEVKAGTALHLELAGAFAAIGYRSYRLVPGLGLLVPFETDAPVDGYLLNLFCCKADRAAMLAARGLLAEMPGTNAQDSGDVNDAQYGWQRSLASMPYVARLAEDWQRVTAKGAFAESAQALALHARARDRSLGPAERFAALAQSYQLLRKYSERDGRILTLLSLARAARELGNRSVAVNALGRFIQVLLERRQIEIGEPFLVPEPRFEAMTPGADLGRWLLAAALEALERASAFSSFYGSGETLARLSMIHELGFGGDEMHRRLDLVRARIAPPAQAA